jgi:hypothetical protein
MLRSSKLPSWMLSIDSRMPGFVGLLNGQSVTCQKTCRSYASIFELYEVCIRTLYCFVLSSSRCVCVVESQSGNALRLSDNSGVECCYVSCW